MQVDDVVNPAFVRDSFPSQESSYTARFYFDPNGLALNSGNGETSFATIFRLRGLGDPAVLVVDLGYQPGADYYQLVVSVQEDSREWVYYPVSLITDGPHSLEISWGAASESGAKDGWLRYWIDGELAFEDLGVDNGDQRVTAAELGVRNVPDITAQGVICFDVFASATAGYIGEVAGVHGCSAEMEEGGGAPNQGQAPMSIFLPIAVNDAAPAAPAQPPGIAAVTTITYTTVITYVYDDLYRLTSASYNSGNSFDYSYDSVGNRLELQHCLSGVGCTSTTYTYDVGNRLTSVDDGTGAVGNTWDGNGNLLDDGTFAYAYDSANRLTSADDGQSASSYVYNGVGDRLSLTEGVTTTQFTLNLAIGLTQVLDDGENRYLYGNVRLAQDDGVDTEYFLGDALGSMRQLADGTGEPTLVQDFKPYGEVLSGTGNGLTNYGFTGEWTDSHTKLVYLRSRYYAPENGRFLTRDDWPGDFNRPLSLNGWLYTYANPVNFVDPSGKIPCGFLPPGPDREECLRYKDPPYEVGPNELRVVYLGGSDYPPALPVLCGNPPFSSVWSITRRVTINIQPKIGTISFTYNKSRATLPIPHGNRVLLRASGEESVAIRTMLSEVTGARYRNNVHGVQEGLGILYTAHNRANNPAWGCSTISTCFVVDAGVQYAITASDVFIGWDPLCLGYYENCNSAYGTVGLPGPVNLWEESLDLAATSYHLFKAGLISDFTQGADTFAHGDTYTNFYICYGPDGGPNCDKTPAGIKAHVLCEQKNPLTGKLELCPEKVTDQE